MLAIMKRLLVLILCALIGGVAWSHFAQSPREIAEGVGMQRILAEADGLISTADQKHSLEPSNWPTAIRLLKPEKVYLDEEGLYIRLNGFFVTESGIFVLSPKTTFSPEQRGDPSYVSIGDRLYEYHISG